MWLHYSQGTRSPFATNCMLFQLCTIPEFVSLLLLRDQTVSEAPGLHWLTPLLFNGVFRCHSHSRGPEFPFPYTHKRPLPIHPYVRAHSQTSGVVVEAEAGGGERMGIAPTGGTLLDLWMRQKSHYELLWLADRSLSAAELQTKAPGRS